LEITNLIKKTNLRAVIKMTAKTPKEKETEKEI
jgi:hypothetical protein